MNHGANFFVSLSLFIQHCSNARLIYTTNYVLTTEILMCVPIFGFLYTETGDYGKLTHLCTTGSGVGEGLLNLEKALKEIEDHLKE